MKKQFTRLVLGLSIVLSAVAMAADQPATPPTWWEQYGITLGSPVEPGAILKQSGNGRIVTVGQLKTWATGARDYLDSALLANGGAGQSITDALASLDDSDPGRLASAAQFQSVMQPIYDRLLAAGFDTQASLQAHGAGAEWASKYPWAEAPAGPDDPAFDMDAYTAWQAQQTAPADMSQAKLALSFDLSDFTTKTDLPGNGAGLAGKHGQGAGVDSSNATAADDESSAKNGLAAASASASASAKTAEADQNSPALALVVLTPLE